MMRRSGRALLLVGLALSLCRVSAAQTPPAPPSAVEAPPTKLLLDVQGPNAWLVRKTLFRTLTREGFQVVFSPAGSLPPRPSAARLLQAARSRRATAVLMVTVDRRRRRSVMLRLYGGDRWQRPVVLRWRAQSPGALRRVPPVTLARLEKWVARLAAVPPVPPTPPATVPGPDVSPTPPVASDGGTAPTPAPTEPPAVASSDANPPKDGAAEDEDSEAEEPDVETDTEVAAPAGPSPLEVTVGVRVFSRRLLLDDTPTRPLPRYRLGLGPAVVAEVDWYPGAHFGSGAYAHIGVTAGIASGFALRSTVGDSVFPTDALSLHIGLRGRVPVGPVTLVGTVAYASRAFTFLPSLTLLEQAPVPDVRYQGPRFAFEARWAIVDRFSVRLGGGYHLITSTGEVGGSAFFPRLRASAVDAQLAALVGLVPGWALRAAVDFNHTFLETRAQPGDVNVGARGIDQSWGASLAVIFTLS